MVMHACMALARLASGKRTAIRFSGRSMRPESFSGARVNNGFTRGDG